MKHSDAAVGMLVVTPMGRVGRVIHVSEYKVWITYIGSDAHLGGVELDARLLRLASPRELMAAGVETEA